MAKLSNIKHNLDKLPKKITKAQEKLMTNIGNLVLRTIKKTLADSNISRNSKLSKSFTKKVIRKTNYVLDVEISSSSSYYNIVDKGVPPGGRFPNIESLSRSIKRKYGADGKELKRLAYLIGRKIQREGIRPVNYIERTINIVEPIIRAELKDFQKKYIEG